ncbi:MAG: hypothetical protein ACP5NV_04335 [Candidatus Woesearchaeota archaeon]
MQKLIVLIKKIPNLVLIGIIIVLTYLYSINNSTTWQIFEFCLFLLAHIALWSNTIIFSKISQENYNKSEIYISLIASIIFISAIVYGLLTGHLFIPIRGGIFEVNKSDKIFCMYFINIIYLCGYSVFTFFRMVKLRK